MDGLEILRLLLLAAHILGLAAIIGAFFMQLGRKSGFDLRTILIGAVTQLVTGIALVGVIEGSNGDVNNLKIGIKLLIAVIVFVAAFIGWRQTKKTDAPRRKITPWLHTAGGLAIVNVLVAVLWT